MRHAALLSPVDAATLEDETLDYFARLGTELRQDVRQLVDQFVRGCKDDGILDPWIAGGGGILLFACGAIGDIVQNVLSRRWCAGVIPTGGATPNFEPYLGIQGDGVQKYLLLGFKPGDLPGATASNYWFGDYVYADSVSAGWDFGASGGGNDIAIQSHNGNNTRFLSSSTTSDPVATLSGVGFNGIFRGSGASYVANHNGAETTFTRTAGALPSGAMVALRNGATGVTYSPACLSAVLWGTDANLIGSADNRAKLVDRLNTLMLGIGCVSSDDLDPQPEFIGANCWGPTAISTVTPSGLRIFRNSPPPIDNSQTAALFSRYPGSDYATNQVDKLISSTWTGGNGHAWNWVSRANIRATNQANPTFPTIRTSTSFICAYEFDSYAKSDAADLARLRYILGSPGHNGGGTGYLDALNAAGMSDSAWLDYAHLLATNPATGKPYADDYFTGPPTNGNSNQKVALNMVVGHNARLCDAPLSNLRKGVVFDVEPADGRSAAQLLAKLLPLAAETKAAGYEAIIWPNELTGGNAGNEGLGPTSIYQLLAAFDLTGVMAWPGDAEHDITTAIAAQLVACTGSPAGSVAIPYQKLMMTVGEPGLISSADAGVIHDYIAGTVTSAPPASGASRQFGASIEWPDNEPPGGVITRQYNQTLAISWGMPTS